MQLPKNYYLIDLPTVTHHRHRDRFYLMQIEMLEFEIKRGSPIVFDDLVGHWNGHLSGA